jgi:hypothetical protein
VWTKEKLEADWEANPETCLIALLVGKDCEGNGGVYRILPAWLDAHFGGPIIKERCGKVVENWATKAFGSHDEYADNLKTGDDLFKDSKLGSSEKRAEYVGEYLCSRKVALDKPIEAIEVLEEKSIVTLFNGFGIDLTNFGKPCYDGEEVKKCGAERCACHPGGPVIMTSGTVKDQDLLRAWDNNGLFWHYTGDSTKQIRPRVLNALKDHAIINPFSPPVNDARVTFTKLDPIALTNCKISAYTIGGASASSKEQLRAIAVEYAFVSADPSLSTLPNSKADLKACFAHLVSAECNALHPSPDKFAEHCPTSRPATKFDTLAEVSEEEYLRSSCDACESVIGDKALFGDDAVAEFTSSLKYTVLPKDKAAVCSTEFRDYRGAANAFAKAQAPAVIWNEAKLVSTKEGADKDSCYIAIFAGEKCKSDGGIYKISPTWYTGHFGGPFKDFSGGGSCGKVVESWPRRSGSHNNWIENLRSRSDIDDKAFFESEMFCARTEQRKRRAGHLDLRVDAAMCIGHFATQDCKHTELSETPVCNLLKADKTRIFADAKNKANAAAKAAAQIIAVDEALNADSVAKFSIGSVLAKEEDCIPLFEDLATALAQAKEEAAENFGVVAGNSSKVRVSNANSAKACLSYFVSKECKSRAKKNRDSAAGCVAIKRIESLTAAADVYLPDLKLATLQASETAYCQTTYLSAVNNASGASDAALGAVALKLQESKDAGRIVEKVDLKCLGFFADSACSPEAPGASSFCQTFNEIRVSSALGAVQKNGAGGAIQSGEKDTDEYSTTVVVIVVVVLTIAMSLVVGNLLLKYSQGSAAASLESPKAPDNAVQRNSVTKEEPDNAVQGNSVTKEEGAYGFSP